ncbi:MAG: serine hydrolase [Gammaproteobacteria bacterium]|nr:serine hydrolase [Gammaproteobacteria bacterium]
MNMTSQQAGFAADRLERITSHIDANYIEPGKIAGCQVLVSRRGSVAYRRSFGRMDIERDKPMADDAIFRIYSMSKPITSVALMQLYERGLFQLNDPVSRLVPSWKNHKVWVSGEGDEMETKEPDARPSRSGTFLSHSGGLTYGRRLSSRRQDVP